MDGGRDEGGWQAEQDHDKVSEETSGATEERRGTGLRVGGQEATIGSELEVGQAADRLDAESGVLAGETSGGQLERREPTRGRAKISHRSQSSPSSLTTHKFGLRPTPSPPRLIIDHKTGDIVESYPEQPIYLRTYQPLDDEEGQLEESALDDSLAHPYPPPLSSRSEFEQYNQLLADQYGRQHEVATSMQAGNMSRNQVPYRPVIPPPHSAGNKVYFAPPEPSAGHLFSQQQPLLSQAPFDEASYPFRSQNERNQLLEQAREATTTSGSARFGRPAEQQLEGSPFKRAVGRLNDSARTDVAIVTDSEQFGQQASLRVTATNRLVAPKSKRNVNQEQGEPQQQLGGKFNQPHRIRPAIEDFNLYDLFYCSHTLMVVALSSLIIYLLAFIVPISVDCSLFRPTYTYISIIVSSVNLVCIIIFTLFWFCNGVTRTLYANLSSSAFIITIYSILVAINLALAILFFFINTCHSQRLLSTSKSPLPVVSHRNLIVNPGGEQLASMSLLARGGSLLGSLDDRKLEALGGGGGGGEGASKSWYHSIDGEDSRGAGASGNGGGRQRGRRASGEGGEPRPLDGAPAGGRDLEELESELGAQATPTVYALSPIEAAWEFARDHFRNSRRNLLHFLVKYDLRLIGAKHAVCAISLQYMALRVAVVRSYFCSPVGGYV